MTDRSREGRDDIVARLVGEALERRDETGGVDIDDLCSEHPELADEVREALAVASRLPGMQTAGVGGDRAIGSVFADRYRIDERIGAGAMGVVYGATDLDLGREVALKVLHVGLLDAEQAAARFEREAAALAAIDHEAVVTIHDRGVTEDGSPFLVMERIDGVSMAHVLDEARSISDLRDDTAWLSERLGIEGLEEPSFLRQSVRWSASLASGLEAAHRAGVYHRDVKPSNVMVRRDGRAVLLDFGIAAKDDQATLTRSDAAIGTPAYMAPEALSGRTKARPSQDVYGLSATLYHLLTLQAPYKGSPSEVLTALALREPVPAFRVRPGLPRDAQAILDTGLARRPADRYASAEEFENDLRSFLAYRPVTARPISTIERTWRRVRRSRAFQGAAAVAVVFAGYLVYDAVRAADVRAQERERTERRTAFRSSLWTRVPANHLIVGADVRRLEDPEHRAAVRSVLDAAIEIGDEVVAPHMARAGFLLDHGDAAGAARDMDSIAAHLETPFAEELAARYAALDPSATGHDALDLEDLPAPEAPLDHYLLAVHAFRSKDYRTAVPAIQHLDEWDVRHAEELRLTTLVAPLMGRSFEDRFLPAGDAYEEILRAEERLGGRSAMTAHWAGVALLLQDRNNESLAMSREAVALAPTSHVSWNNIADRAWYLGRLDEAQAACERALAIQPSYDMATSALALVLLDRGEYDESVATLVDAPFPATVDGENRRQMLLGEVHAEYALIAYVDEDFDRARNASRTAIDHLSSVSTSSKDKKWLLRVCRAIDRENSNEVVLELIDRQFEEPLRHQRLETLLRMLPDEERDPEVAARLEDLLRSVAHALSRRASLDPDVR